MQNPAYIRGSEEDIEMSQNGLKKSERSTRPDRPLAPPGERKSPPGEEVVEPAIVKANALKSGALFSARRRSYEHLNESDSFKVLARPEENNITHGEKNDGENEIRNGQQSESRADSAMSQTSQKSQSSVVEHIEKSDEFPWSPKPVQNVRFSPDQGSPSGSLYDAQVRRASAISKEEEKKRARFLWWKRIVTTLEDNKILTKEAMSKLIKFEKAQDRHFRLVKKVMNVVFLMSGIILLLAVIVVIINTDPFFEESMRALTVFLAGRRQGIW